jgi:hypothetical protein
MMASFRTFDINWLKSSYRHLQQLILAWFVPTAQTRWMFRRYKTDKFGVRYLNRIFFPWVMVGMLAHHEQITSSGN